MARLALAPRELRYLTQRRPARFKEGDLFSDVAGGKKVSFNFRGMLSDHINSLQWPLPRALLVLGCYEAVTIPRSEYAAYCWTRSLVLGKSSLTAWLASWNVVHAACLPVATQEGTNAPTLSGAARVTQQGLVQHGHPNTENRSPLLQSCKRFRGLREVIFWQRTE